MRQEVEFSYDIEPTEGSSHEDFSVKIRDYLCIRFGQCEVLYVLNNLGKNGELKLGCEHNYSIVLKFENNITANQIKQKFQGSSLFKVCFFTSWWPRKQHPYVAEDSVATPTRGSGRGRGRWPMARGGRFASWRGSKFSISTAHFRGGRGTRRPYRAGFTSPRGHGMFRRSDIHSQEATFGDHSSQKSEQEPSPGSSSSHTTSSLTRRRSLSLRRKVSTIESPSSLSPKRVRRVSMASSTSESNSEHGGSEKGHSSESSSVDSYPRITSPIRIDSDNTKEPKSEGRVLRSHSSQLVSKRRKQAQSKSKSTTPVSSQPAGSRYNTRSKKRSLDEKETPSPKKHQPSCVKDLANESDDSSYGKRQAYGLRKKEQVRSVVALERVVTIVDSDSSSTKCLQSSKVSGAGESSQSEEEVWVERKVEMMIEKQEVQEPLNVPTRKLSTADTSTPKTASDEPTGGKTTPTTKCEPQDEQKVHHVTGASSFTTSARDLQDVPETSNAEEKNSQLSDYSCNTELRSAMMSPHEERDETPPAELLEATHQYMMQGDYSEWFRENFQNDPQAWQRYMDYYNAMMMAGGTDGDRSAATAEGAVSSQPTAVAATADEMVPGTTDGDGIQPTGKSAGSTLLQRTQSLPPVSTSSDHSSDSVERTCKSLPPDWTKLKTGNKSGQVINALEDAIPVFLGEVLPMDKPSPMTYSTEDNGPVNNHRNGDSIVQVGCQIPTATTQECIEAKRQINSARRKVSRKYRHLQKHALRKFLQSAKPLILSTDTLIRHSPSSEDALMSALSNSLENISNDLVGELWNKIDTHSTASTPPTITNAIA